MAKDLILEIGSEELPAGFIAPALNSLRDVFEKDLKTRGLVHKNIELYGTPRRLAIIISGLEEKQPDSIVEARGPNITVAYDKDGKPTKALEGFAKSQGVELSEIKRVKGDKGEYVYAIKKIKGVKTTDVLPSLLHDAIARLNFPKAMRWGSHDTTYARPMHWLLALYGGKTVHFDYAHIKSSNETRGHRFVKSGKIKISGIKDYIEKLKKSCVLVDPGARKSAIDESIREAAKAVGGEVLFDDTLLDEVVNLVECPVVLRGTFDKEFLALPREVVVNAMREHQRYFSVIDKKGALLPYFITVANTPVKKESVVIEGNERVLRARLNDAKFYYEKDLKTPLVDRVSALKGVVFQAKLGTSYEKADRFTRLALFIGSSIGFSEDSTDINDPAIFLNDDFVKRGVAGGMLDVTTIGDSKVYNKYILGRGAMLAKADLVSGMVGEFPKLQGVMGKEYALKSNEADEVASAIYEHHLPLTSGGSLPASTAGAIISISDKLDTIAGCFGVGLVPSGASDPYALRRGAIGIISILIDKSMRLHIDRALDAALNGLGDKFKRPRAEVKNEILEFFKERFKNQLTAQGNSYDVVDAILATPWYDIVDATQRAAALEKFKSHEACSRLVVAFKRVSNILKGIDASMALPDENLFVEKDEKELYKTEKALAPAINKHLVSGNYEKAFSELASIKDSIDSFFDHVMVMAEDEKLKTNRLKLLNSVRNLYIRAADLSKLVVSENN